MSRTASGRSGGLFLVSGIPLCFFSCVFDARKTCFVARLSMNEVRTYNWRSRCQAERGRHERPGRILSPPDSNWSKRKTGDRNLFPRALPFQIEKPRGGNGYPVPGFPGGVLARDCERFLPPKTLCGPRLASLSQQIFAFGRQGAGGRDCGGGFIRLVTRSRASFCIPPNSS